MTGRLLEVTTIPGPSPGSMAVLVTLRVGHTGGTLVQETVLCPGAWGREETPTAQESEEVFARKGRSSSRYSMKTTQVYLGCGSAAGS